MIPHRWLELRISFPPQGAADLSAGSFDPRMERVSSLLMDLGGRAVEERGGELTTYVPPPDRLQDFLESVRRGLEALDPMGELGFEWRWQAQEDWESLWRRGLDTRRISHRLVVTPSWIPVQPRGGEYVITLDPGMAFGTAEHPTTRSSLRLMDPLVRAGSRIADVGSGSGILSIAAVFLGAAEVFAFESDPLACDTARENLAINGVSDRVHVLEHEVGGLEPLSGSPFEGVVANLQTFLHLPLLQLFRISLQPDGWVVLAGILTREKDELVSAAVKVGLHLGAEDVEGDWWAGSFRPSPSPVPG